MIPDRMSRVNSLVQEELSKILERYQERWSPLGPGFLFTVTRVEVERNLEKAAIFYSWTVPSGSQASNEEVEQILTEITGPVVHELARRIKLKKFPHFTFVYDPNVIAGDKVYEILEKIKREENNS